MNNLFEGLTIKVVLVRKDITPYQIGDIDVIGLGVEGVE